MRQRTADGPAVPHRDGPAIIRWGERGGAVVEFAIIFPVFAMIALASITGGMALSEKTLLAHASREGGRYGATLAWDQEFPSGTWADVVRQRVIERSAGELDTSEVCVALVEGVPGVPISDDHTTNADGSACWDDGAASASSRVQVEVRGEAVIDGAIFTIPLQLIERSTAHSEREPPPEA